MKYRTIVADPPWHYDSWPSPMSALIPGMVRESQTFVPNHSRKKLDYPSMTVEEIASLPVPDFADNDGAHVYLWTTNRYLRDAFHVFDAWGVRYGQTLVWAKTPRGQGPGGTFAQNAEFVLFGRRGTLRHLRRAESVWYRWQRQGAHSKKPEAFIDLVEQVSPGPYLELFARRQRLGWDTWGNECFNAVDLSPLAPTPSEGVD